MCLAVPGKIVSIMESNPLERCGRVSFGGVLRDVSLACVPDAQPGSYVLVHAGFALQQIDESEAHRTLDLLAKLGEDIESELP